MLLRSVMKILDVPQSGSLADSTSSRNRFGQYRRTRATPVQPRTDRQNLIRGWLTAASQAWRSLSEEIRTGWNSYAAETARLDSLGQTIYLSGLQQFVGNYVAARNAGTTFPPAIPSVAPAAPPSGLSVDSSAGPGQILISADVAPATGGFIIIEASPQLSPGINFNGNYRVVQVFPSAGGFTELDITDNYEAKFGAIIAGKKIFYRAYYYYATQGRGGATTLAEIVGS